MQYHIVFQRQPYFSYPPAAMIVSADDRVEAYITAADTLIRRGHVMSFSNSDKVLTDAELVRVKAAFPDYPTYAGTAIRSIADYNPTPTGRVVSILGAC